MIGSGDDVDRLAPNPNRVTQPFDRIGKGEDVSEMEARERYWWSRARYTLKKCSLVDFYGVMNRMWREEPEIVPVIEARISKTFTAGCIALGDPAPLDKEQDHE